MRITTLCVHKGETWKIAFNDETALTFLHVSIVERFSLTNGQDLTESAWRDIQFAELSRKAYSYAQYLLDRRAYSYKEMYRKLAQKYPEDVCYDAVNRLARYGLIDDRAYAAEAAHHYVEVKKYGYRRAAQQMQQRGLLREQIEAALAQLEESFAENLETLVAGKYRHYFVDPQDRKEIEKGKAALIRMGYDYGAVKETLDRYFEKYREEG